MTAEVDTVLAQQLVSPEVHADQRVTFRLRARNASRVELLGIEGVPPTKLTKDEHGVWSVTIGPLPPELYSYNFRVDGMDCVDPSNRFVKKWLTCASMVEVPGNPPQLHELQNVPHGIVQRIYYPSSVTNSQRPAYVYTPPGYQANQKQKLPVVYLLHGYGDDESAWIEIGRAALIADNLLAQQKIKTMLIVMPYGHPIPVDTRVPFDDYAQKNAKKMERDLLDDLIPFVERSFAAEPDPMHRAIVGLSMGGGQSLQIGLNNLSSFAWVGGFSSAVPARKLDQAFVRFAADHERSDDALRLLWLACGKDDFLLPANEAFTEWLNEKNVPHEYHLTAGGHDWIVWRKYLAQFLPRLF